MKHYWFIVESEIIGSQITPTMINNRLKNITQPKDYLKNYDMKSSIIISLFRKKHTELVARIWRSSSLDSSKAVTIFKKLSTIKFKLDERQANKSLSIASIAMFTNLKI